jgi:hypothetical protein
MIAAVKAGCDIYVQKPISVDIREGQAMLAAARKYKRVVQVGMQRRSTPHLITARDRIIREGKLGTIGLVEIYCYYAMRATQNSAGRAAAQPDMSCGPAPRADRHNLVHPRVARLHGVRQRHRRRQHARHGALMLDPDAQPRRPSGGIPSRRPAAPISPTPDGDLRLQPARDLTHRTHAPPDRSTGAPPSTATRARSRPAS